MSSMPDMMATIWVEEVEDVGDNVLLTVAIAGSETLVFLLDPDQWKQYEAGLRDGSVLKAWFTEAPEYLDEQA